MQSAAMVLTVVVVLVVGMLSTTGTSRSLVSDPEAVSPFQKCLATSKQIEQEDRATIVNDGNSRLHGTWFSQQCETRVGPEYIIRRYTFFENSTFLLLRYHYDDVSCSMPTHTVSIRGSVKLLRPSDVVSGATETRIHVDAVYITPLNRQVAHKFEHKMNFTCGPQPRWRRYVPQLVYEHQLRQHSTNQLWNHPVYNSLQARPPSQRLDCLDAFKIEFGELKLLRVQWRLSLPKKSDDSYYRGSRLELLLARPAPNVPFRRAYRTTSLQSTVLIHANTTGDCPICYTISRANEFSPPALHVRVPLPVLIGGYWLSERCESIDGGIWSKRQFQIYSGDKLWTGRWEYYDDPWCSMFLYAITAAGSYQLKGQQHRHEAFASDYFRPLNDSAKLFFKRSVSEVSRVDSHRSNLMDSADELSSPNAEEESSMSVSTKTLGTKYKRRPKKLRRSPTDNVYHFLFDVKSSPTQWPRIAAILRGNQQHATTIRKPMFWDVPSGDTELSLHIAESILIPGDPAVANRCNADRVNMPLTNWPRNCVPRIVEAPSTLNLRAQMRVNWNGQYILLLGPQDDNVWDPPLRQCAQVPLGNSDLKMHLTRSVSLRFGLPSAARASRVSVWILMSQLLLCCLFYRAR